MRQKSVKSATVRALLDPDLVLEETVLRLYFDVTECTRATGSSTGAVCRCPPVVAAIRPARPRDIAPKRYALAKRTKKCKCRVPFCLRCELLPTSHPSLLLEVLAISNMVGKGAHSYGVDDAVRFSSPGLRIFSSAIYSLLAIPGLNLVLPFLFFLALHIAYGESRLDIPYDLAFWLGRPIWDSENAIPYDLIFHIRLFHMNFCGTARRAASTLKSIPKSAIALFRRRRGLLPDLESGTQDSNPPSGRSTPTKPAPDPSKNHPAFLILGLNCLTSINIILLVNIERTLRRNKGYQSPEEDEWGFGQVLAHLRKVKKEEVTQEKIQRTVEEHLKQVVHKNTFVGHDFKDLIEQGADPTVELDKCRILLQLAASMGNEVLVKFMTEKGMEDGEGRAFYIAARHNRFRGACLLGKDRNKSARAGRNDKKSDSSGDGVT
ncbi:hypothetical protein B0H14DRAFT_2575706 [Mycena olivaceomarginata]|nr:hypothetical protein B0H14DRAFT_2575706 [Mycena olivaceomarginata]